MKLLTLLVTVGALNLGTLCGVEVRDLELVLRSDKTVYRVGEEIVFDLEFRDCGNREIRLFPDPEQYDERMFTATSIDGGGRVERLELGEFSTDYRMWARDVVTLPPGKKHTRKIHARLLTELPRDWADPTKGAYLVLDGGTALKLPGFGDYTLSTTYRFGAAHPVVEFIQQRSRLWFGDIDSNSITISLLR